MTFEINIEHFFKVENNFQATFTGLTKEEKSYLSSLILLAHNAKLDWFFTEKRGEYFRFGRKNLDSERGKPIGYLIQRENTCCVTFNHTISEEMQSYKDKKFDLTPETIDLFRRVLASHKTYIENDLKVNRLGLWPDDYSPTDNLSLSMPLTLKQDGTAISIVDTRSTRARRWIPLETITVEKFKAAQKAIIPLDRVTILVGPNGCGKSSVLQAIHWAARAASYIRPKQTSEMISFEQLDFVPSSDPLTTLYKGKLKADRKSTPITVTFKHLSTEEETIQATVRIRAARNSGGITAALEGGNAVTPYKQRYQFITTYIPGLAGLSEKETILAQPTLRRQAASGDAGGVLRNILLNLRARKLNENDETPGQKRMAALNGLIQKVHPGVEVDVRFDDREDYHISAVIRTDDFSSQSRPLETAATGILQVVQIFAYLIFFEPKIMLIDEPDAHLHPDKQERLIEAIEQAASDYDTQIILTTHSPHIVRSASPSAKLVWMKSGAVVTEDDGAIRRLLGWGGLDKAILFFVEDEDDKPLKEILRQWPELARQIAVCRCFGIENLPRDKLLEGLLIDGDLRLRALLHRDGDFMTSKERDLWRDKFITPGVYPWVTSGADIEAYFCQTDYLCALYNIESAVAESWRQQAASSISRAHKTFLDKRRQIVQSLWPNGGSPDAEALWGNDGSISPDKVKGKALHKALKTVIQEAGKDNKLINNFTIPDHFVMAPDLKSLIEDAIKYAV